jgi:hypothetical protein
MEKDKRVVVMFNLIFGYDVVEMNELGQISGPEYMVDIVESALQDYSPADGDVFMFLYRYFKFGKGANILKNSIVIARASKNSNNDTQNVVY